MTTTLSVRIDSDLKKDVEALLEDLGMNVSTAINCFFRKMRETQSIPFAIGRSVKRSRVSPSAAAEPAGEYDVPNAETRAILDRDMAGLEPEYGPFDSTEEMLEAALAMED